MKVTITPTSRINERFASRMTLEITHEQRQSPKFATTCWWPPSPATSTARTASRPADRLDGALATTAVAVFDVTGVPYMSSAGFRLLLLIYRQVSLRGGKVAIVGLSEEIRDTMAVTGFLDFFTIAASAR